jgi:hypothetical protein
MAEKPSSSQNRTISLARADLEQERESDQGKIGHWRGLKWGISPGNSPLSRHG